MQDSPTILLAEDDDGHALLVQAGLRKAGFHNRIMRFHDGQEVLDFLGGTAGSQDVPASSLVLMLDINIPKVDGIRVLEQIRGHSAFAAVPVIMVTTTEDPAEMARCRQLGCDHYLVKPVDWSSFSGNVRTLARFLAAQPADA